MHNFGPSVLVFGFRLLPFVINKQCFVPHQKKDLAAYKGTRVAQLMFTASGIYLWSYVMVQTPKDANTKFQMTYIHVIIDQSRSLRLHAHKFGPHIN